MGEDVDVDVSTPPLPRDDFDVDVSTPPADDFDIDVSTPPADDFDVDVSTPPAPGTDFDVDVSTPPLPDADFDIDIDGLTKSPVRVMDVDDTHVRVAVQSEYRTAHRFFFYVFGIVIAMRDHEVVLDVTRSTVARLIHVGYPLNAICDIIANHESGSRLICKWAEEACEQTTPNKARKKSQFESYDYISESDPEVMFLSTRLRTTTKLHWHQHDALHAMFAGARARSGIIVMPCGAGKTLVGIAAACTISRQCLIFCSSTEACYQWGQQFHVWSTCAPNRDCVLVASTDSTINYVWRDGNRVPTARIFITTYKMMSITGPRSERSQTIVDEIRRRKWGLIIFDEVHMLPANTFSEMSRNLNSRCRLGLTATLLREDDGIDDLSYLIGPVLYDVCWKDLMDSRLLTPVNFYILRCQLPASLQTTYSEVKEIFQRQTIESIHSFKLAACCAIVEQELRNNAKIIIFCDFKNPLKLYAATLHAPFINGDVSDDRRARIIQTFKTCESGAVLIVSRTGDVALDFPSASVAIEVCGMSGSAMQETQRVGRILRTFENKTCAKFYALITVISDRMSLDLNCLPSRVRHLMHEGIEPEPLNDTSLFDKEPSLRAINAQIALIAKQQQEENLV